MLISFVPYDRCNLATLTGDRIARNLRFDHVRRGAGVRTMMIVMKTPLFRHLTLQVAEILIL
jgi:hypothetical protein